MEKFLCNIWFDTSIHFQSFYLAHPRGGISGNQPPEWNQSNVTRNETVKRLLALAYHVLDHAEADTYSHDCAHDGKAGNDSR